MGDEIFDAVSRNLREVVPDVDPAVISAERSLAELGCNSVDRAEIVTMTMADLGISVPVMDLQDVDSVGGLVRLLRDRAG